MKACGDAEDCISTSEAIELAEKLDEKEINNLPRPGQVEFINGGPPCQVWLTFAFHIRWNMNIQACLYSNIFLHIGFFWNESF